MSVKLANYVNNHPPAKSWRVTSSDRALARLVLEEAGYDGEINARARKRASRSRTGSLKRRLIWASLTVLTGGSMAYRGRRVLRSLYANPTL